MHGRREAGVCVGGVRFAVRRMKWRVGVAVVIVWGNESYLMRF